MSFLVIFFCEVGESPCFRGSLGMSHLFLATLMFQVQILV